MTRKQLNTYSKCPLVTSIKRKLFPSSLLISDSLSRSHKKKRSKDKDREKDKVNIERKQRFFPSNIKQL